jgi:hypothetical protein
MAAAQPDRSAQDKVGKFNPLSFLPLREFFSLDVRSLAVFRIGLGLCLISDWLDRVPDLRAHYSDAGIVPRAALTDPGPITIHFFSGEPWFQGLLVAVALVFAVALLVGYRTPLACLLSWFMLLSVHARGPELMQGGDNLLRLLLFWGIFLPLGASYALDAAEPEQRPPGPRVLTVGSVALILQIVQVYLFASAHKWAPEWRDQGTAVYHALQIDYFTTRTGRFLLNYPQALRWLSYSTVYLEALGPVLLFLPFSPALMRLIAIGSFLLFHAGLAITIELGNFPWVCGVAWLALLPTAFWDRIVAKLRTPARTGLSIYHDPASTRSRRRLARLQTLLMLTNAPLLPARDEGGLQARVRGGGGWGVVDHLGKEHHRLDALVTLVRLSPAFGFLAGALIRWPLRPLAERYARALGARDQSAHPATPPPDRRPGWAPPGGLLANTILIFCIIYSILWNVSTLDYESNYVVFPRQMSHLGTVLGLDQGWGLFAPAPGRVSGWYYSVGTQRDGQRISLPDGGPVDERKPELLSATFPNGRWRKLMMNLSLTNANGQPFFPYLLRGYASYLMREWNARHQGDEEVIAVDVYWMSEVAADPGQPRPPATPVGPYHYPPPPPKPAPDRGGALP